MGLGDGSGGDVNPSDGARLSDCNLSVLVCLQAIQPDRMNESGTINYSFHLNNKLTLSLSLYENNIESES